MNNKNEAENIGRFMFSVGALIQYKDTDQILIIRRKDKFNKDEWELLYGRKAQHEGIEEALLREIQEEVHLFNVSIIKALRIWRIYRSNDGKRKSENELIGITFWCRTDVKQVELGNEHEDYKWVSSLEALKVISIDGIKKDIEIFREKHKELGIGFSPLDRNYKFL